MKSAANIFDFNRSRDTQVDNQEHNHTARGRYILVAILLAIVILLSSLTPAGPEAFSLHISSGFVLFWLAGGAITLTLLTLAARKNH